MFRTLTKLTTSLLVIGACAGTTLTANALEVPPPVIGPVITEPGCAPVCAIAIGPHVILIPPPVGEARAAAEARDQQWVKRCHPQIYQDRFGMPRYSYSEPGCEYGRLR